MRSTSKREFTINGISVVITKKRMKNMYIRVDKENLVAKVSIPYQVSYDTAYDFVLNNMDFINKEIEQALVNKENAPCEYISGEALLLWGQTYEIEFIPSYCDKGVYIKDNKAIILAPLDSDAQYRKNLIEKWYRTCLLEAIDELKDECEATTGKSPKQWRIKDMKTKWGTCNYRDGRIWLSLQLVKHPKICLKYVMIHELTHLHVANHGPDFKALMDIFCPNWRSIKKILNGR